VNLTLRERPQVDVLDAPWQRIRDRWKREDVRRSCQQKLPASLVTIESLLDRKKQTGRPLHLVDYGRPVDFRDEAPRIAPRPVGGHLIIQRDITGRELVHRKIPRERALPHLACTEQRHRAALSQRFEHMRTSVTRYEPGRHQLSIAFPPGRLGVYRPAD
jgi:hypothetical protein